MKRTITALLALSLLAGCAQTQTETEPVQEEEVIQETYTVQENAYYRAPANPTKYIAQTYNDLSALMPTVELEVDETEDEETGTDWQDETWQITETEEDQTLPEVTADDETVAAAAVIYFLSDFFTLKNKEDESEIGGLDLIPSASAEDFIEYAKYYYYNSLPVIRNQQGEDALPEVINISLTNQKAGTFTYLDEEYEGYSFTAGIQYAQAPDATDFKTRVNCKIIKMQDIHYQDAADVTAEEDAGTPQEVWRILAVTD